MLKNTQVMFITRKRNYFYDGFLLIESLFFMSTTITFNQLRKIKDSLPQGSIRSIAESLNLNVETVRNYFGGSDYVRGNCIGIHIEQGPDGGIVELDDTTILDMARNILAGKSFVPVLN